MTARRVLLDGLARDADLFELVSELAPLHPRDNTFPGEVFLRLAADALDWCGASRADPLPLEGLRERFLPECTFRGRHNTNLVPRGHEYYDARFPGLLRGAAYPQQAGHEPSIRRSRIAGSRPRGGGRRCGLGWR